MRLVASTEMTTRVIVLDETVLHEETALEIQMAERRVPDDILRDFRLIPRDSTFAGRFGGSLYMVMRRDMPAVIVTWAFLLAAVPCFILGMILK